jgi:tRNA(fMet)-specific endonuclease VapC
VTYLLDTNACIALINDSPSGVRTHFKRILSAGNGAAASTITAYELWYGVAKSARPEANAKKIELFFSGPVGLLPFEEADGKFAGRVRATLESAGKPIEAYDLLIGGQALRHKLILVTANVNEFRRIKGLACEDWAKS